VNNLPLLDLFTRLREAGLPLGVGEYELALEALQGGYGVTSRDALARLCRTLWVKSPEDDRIFTHHFDQTIGPAVLPVAKADKLAPIADSKMAVAVGRMDSIAQNPTSLGQPTDAPVEPSKIPIAILVGTVALCVTALSLVTLTFLQSRPPVTVGRSAPPNPPTRISEPLLPPQKPIPRKNSPTTPKPWLKLVPPIVPEPVKPKTPLPSPFLALLGQPNTWGVLGAVAFLAGFSQMKRRANRLQQSASQTVPPIAHPPKPPTLAPSSELLREIEDEVQAARVARGATDGGKGEFFPVTRRQMKQSWRHLRRPVREGRATELDVEATVNQIGRQGMLLDPVLVPPRVNRLELLLLIDQDGSMIPFHALSERLIRTATQEGRLGHFSIYYFRNCPTLNLYRDRHCRDAEPLQTVLETLQNTRTVVLVISDAGAARGVFNPDRLRMTRQFVAQLQRHARYIAWLNPVPRSRWSSTKSGFHSTTAGQIAELVPMFEVTRAGLDSAIDVLRGRYHKLHGETS